MEPTYAQPEVERGVVQGRGEGREKGDRKPAYQKGAGVGFV